jgi:hypothetical protein
MTMDGCERRKTEPSVVRFMTTVQSSLGWRKPTPCVIVKLQSHVSRENFIETRGRDGNINESSFVCH